MPFDGLTIAAVCKELTLHTRGQRIDKIYQMERDEIVLSVRANKGNLRLIISANPQWARLHATSIRKPAPPSPPAFCMLLRKHLEGGKIKAISQAGCERIIHLRVEALNELMEWKEKVLVCEFMGKHSNIILVDPENNTIIDAIKKYNHEVSSYREVIPGKQYVLPPSQDKLNPYGTAYEEFVRRIWQCQMVGIAKALFTTYTGTSPFTARELCLRCGIDPDLPAEQCGELELSSLFCACRTLWEQVATDNMQSTVLTSRQGVIEFAPYELKPGSQDQQVCSFPSINQAVDFYFSQKLSQARLESLQTNRLRSVNSYLDKAYRRRMLQEGDLAQAQDSEKYRVWGELLTAYAHQFKKGQSRVELEDFYSGNTIEIELRPHLSPIENAQRFFKVYNKAKTSAHHAQARLQATQEEIAYLESVAVALQQADSLVEIEEITEELEKEGYVKDKKSRPRQARERSQPRSFISADGLEILVGRNNHQNDRLTLKESERNHLWLHAREIPGSHVIIRLPRQINNIDQVPDRTLEEAALLAAYFSKGNEADKVPVDYTFRQNVHKPRGAKPGMVVYDNYWTIWINPTDARLERLLAPQPD